jgi:uncharacterized membrane protein YciS (DUF1049 family)
MKPKTILLLVLVVLAVILLIQNTQIITFRLYFWQVSISQVILVPLIFVIGFVLGFLVEKFEKRKEKKGLASSAQIPPKPPSQP